MRKQLALLALASASPIAITTTAHAQSGPVAAADGDILVTAQRREESINDVPLAVSAFSADTLRQLNVVDVEDVADHVAGVQIFRTNGGQPTWIIRGVGLVETNPNNPPPASIFLDDIYQVTTVQSQMPTFDVARIEVLKGPQGGTYGRNTTGGAIRIISREPSLTDVGVDATITAASYQRLTFDGGISIPLISDTLGLRLAAFADRGGGWQYSLSDRRDAGDADRLGVRGTLLFQSGTVRAKLVVDHSVDRSETPLLRAAGARATAAEGGTTAALWCPDFNAGSFSDRCRTYPGVLNALGFTFLPLSNPALQAPDGSTSWSNTANFIDADTTGVTFDLRVDFGGATLVALTGYRTLNYYRSVDLDATGAELGHTTASDDFKIFSQELRLQSDGAGPFTWAFGAALADERLRNQRQFLFRDDPFTFAGFAIYGVANRSQALANVAYRQTSRTYSAYVEAGYDVTPQINISGALRYTNLKKNYTNGGFNFPLATGAVSTLAAVQSLVNFRLADTYRLRSNWSGNLYLRWQPTETFTGYASVGRGIKEGGFFGGFPGNGQDSIVPFREETVWAFELGFKSQWANRRVGLNGAVFYYDYADAQATVPVVSATGAVFGRPGNVDARHVGAELEAFIRPVDGFRINGSVTYLDAKYTDSIFYSTQDTGGRAPYDGLRREFAPRWSWTLGARWDIDLGDSGALAIMGDANGRTNRFEPRLATVNSNPALAAPTTRRELTRRLDGYVLVNGRIQYTLPGDKMTLALWGRNLTDKRYVIISQTDGIAPNYGTYFNDPRTFGLELGFRL